MRADLLDVDELAVLDPERDAPLVACVQCGAVDYASMFTGRTICAPCAFGNDKDWARL